MEQAKLAMDLIEQAAMLEGLSVYAEALAAMMRNGDTTVGHCAGAVALLGKEIKSVSARIMLLQEGIDGCD